MFPTAQLCHYQNMYFRCFRIKMWWTVLWSFVRCWRGIQAVVRPCLCARCTQHSAGRSCRCYPECSDQRRAPGGRLHTSVSSIGQTAFYNKKKSRLSAQGIQGNRPTTFISKLPVRGGSVLSVPVTWITPSLCRNQCLLPTFIRGVICLLSKASISQLFFNRMFTTGSRP